MREKKYIRCYLNERNEVKLSNKKRMKSVDYLIKVKYNNKSTINTK